MFCFVTFYWFMQACKFCFSQFLKAEMLILASGCSGKFHFNLLVRRKEAASWDPICTKSIWPLSHPKQYLVRTEWARRIKSSIIVKVVLYHNIIYFWCNIFRWECLFSAHFHSDAEKKMYKNSTLPQENSAHWCAPLPTKVSFNQILMG